MAEITEFKYSKIINSQYFECAIALSCNISVRLVLCYILGERRQIPGWTCLAPVDYIQSLKLNMTLHSFCVVGLCHVCAGSAFRFPFKECFLTGTAGKHTSSLAAI